MPAHIESEVVLGLENNVFQTTLPCILSGKESCGVCLRFSPVMIIGGGLSIAITLLQIEKKEIRRFCEFVVGQRNHIPTTA
jgi:hypothetical protein